MLEQQDTTTSGAVQARPDDGRRLRRRRSFLALGVTAAVCLPFAPDLVDRLTPPSRTTGPSAFSGLTESASGFDRPYEAGVAYQVGLGQAPLPDVTVLRARPVLGEGSAPAALTVSVCRSRPGSALDGSSAVEGELSAWCREAFPVEGQVLGRLQAEDRLVLTVVPLADGPVLVESIDFDYEQDGHRADERVRVNFWLRRCDAASPPLGCS